MRKRWMASAVAVAVVTLAGCGGSSQDQKNAQEGMQKAAAGAQQASQAAQQGAQQGAAGLAQGLQQMAQGLSQATQQVGPDGKPIPVVDFEKLVALLPTVDGWEREEPKGSTQDSPFRVSTAEARYTKGNFHVHVEITDAAFNSMLMGAASMGISMGCSERSTSGYKKSSTNGVTQTCEEFRKDSNHVEVTSLVNKRFVVKVEGDGVDSVDPVKEISDKIDLNKLANLK